MKRQRSSLPKKRYTKCQEAHEKNANIISHLVNAKQNPFTPIKMAILYKFFKFEKERERESINGEGAEREDER